MKFDRDLKEIPSNIKELNHYYIMSFGDMIAKKVVDKNKLLKDI